MKSKSTNLQSSAGITKYDDYTKESISLYPKWIIYFGFIISLFILLMSYFYGTWPKVL